jgi:hypothetical protein
MASIYKEIPLAVPADRVWAAVRDVGAIHTRLAQAFVVDTRLDGDSRLVTFANGEVVRERIVDVDDGTRRLAYAVVEWRTTHHNASFQVVPDGQDRCRLIWITDLLPNTLAGQVGEFIGQGCAAIKTTLEASCDSPDHAPDRGSGTLESPRTTPTVRHERSIAARMP